MVYAPPNRATPDSSPSSLDGGRVSNERKKGNLMGTKWKFAGHSQY